MCVIDPIPPPHLSPVALKEASKVLHIQNNYIITKKKHTKHHGHLHTGVQLLLVLLLLPFIHKAPIEPRSIAPRTGAKPRHQTFAHEVKQERGHDLLLFQGRHYKGVTFALNCWLH